MNADERARQDIREGMARGYHDIPDDAKLQAMSYVHLSEEFQSSKKDSPRLHVLDREMKRRIAQDQAEANRPNIRLGAYMGGGFALAGVVLGALLTHLSNNATKNKITPPAAVQQIPQNAVQIQPQTIYSQPSNPPATQGAISPSPTKTDAPGSKNPP